MITTVQCSIPSQLNNKPRVVVTDVRLHHTCSIIIVWLHSLSGVIRSLLCNPCAFSPGIITICVCANIKIGVIIFIGVAMQPEALVAATLAVSQERKSFTTNHTSILKIVRFNAQNVAQFDA